MCRILKANPREIKFQFVGEVRIVPETVSKSADVLNIFIHQHMLIATNENKQRNNLN